VNLSMAGAMKRLLLIVAVLASACEAAAQSGGVPSIRSESSPSSSTSPEGIGEATAEEALRRAVWHSTEMLDARAYVLTYAERSARSSRAQGEQYLRRVSQLSSEQMTEWLQRLQRQRAELEGRRMAEEDARELTLRLTEERSRLTAEAGFNVQQTKARLTDLWLQRQAELAAPLSSRRDQRAAIAAGLRLAYDPMAPALDPASPPRTERAMAAASLPGDLPRGDPANFYRGDDRGGGIVIPTGGGVANAGGAGGGDASVGDAGGAAGSEAGSGGE
jgi:hypothetical protein